MLALLWMVLLVMEDAIGHGRGRVWRMCAHMLKLWLLKLRRHHLWWLDRFVVRVRRGHILVVLIVHIFSFAGKISRSFVLIGSSILDRN